MHAMIQRLELENFSVFAELSWKLSSGANVVIGDNGTGKSHLLKILYAVQSTLYRASLESGAPWTRDQWQREFARRIVALFRPDSLGRLVARNGNGTRARVVVGLANGSNVAFAFANNSSVRVEIDGPVPSPIVDPPIFLPSHEMLANVLGFAAAFDRRELQFDETYRDLARLLENAPLRGRPPEAMRPIRDTLRELLKGNVERRADGSFELVPDARGEGAMEAPLLAEGHRKIATLAYLVRNGQLGTAPTLYWDEPEANLNPRTLAKVARLVAWIAAAGVQVVMATHSLFLLREFMLLQETGGLRAVQYSALGRSDRGRVSMQTHSDANQVGPIDALDADLEQADRFVLRPVS